MIKKERIQTIFSNCPLDTEVIILKNGSDSFIDKNFFYTTGLNQGIFEGCAVVLFPDGNVHIIVSSLEEELAKKTDASVHTFKTRKELSTVMETIIGKSDKIGINASYLLYSDYVFLHSIFKQKEFIDISKIFDYTRMIKDKEEIKNIKKACEIADKVAEKIPDFISKGMHEFELAAEINYHLQRFGAQKPAFETISSFGSNTAMPHYAHGNKKLMNGDFILCDFGATINNYHSDTSRTFVYGSASSKQREIYETVMKSQEIALDTIHPNIQAKKIHQVTYDFIEQSKFKGCFIHSTGHSLGLNVHDPGVGFNFHCDEILKENMVLTVEPGIYLSDYGGVRIEDDIVIRSEGCELLTTSSKSLIEI